MITIPQVARSVPGSYTFRSTSDTRIARLAQILEGLGVLTLEHAPRPRPKNGKTPPWPSESAMVEAAIAAWTERATGRLEVFSEVFLAVSSNTVESYQENLRYLGDDETADEIDPDSILFVLAPWDQADCWVMRRRCEAIEKACPGLAQTALDALHFACHRTVQSLLPPCAAEFGEMMYGWGMEEDDSEESRLSRKSFRDSFPPWVLADKRKLSRPRIAELAKRNEVARAVRDLDEAIADRRALLMGTSSQYIASFAMVLRWSEKDPMTQIADDWINDAQNGGESTSDFAVAAVKLDPDSVREFLDRFSRMLRTLACADRLVTLIAERQ